MSFGPKKTQGINIVNPLNLTPAPKVWIDSEHVTGSDNAIITDVENMSNIVVSSEPGIYTTGCKYRGINIAGAEYGNDWDGWTGQTFFTWRSPAARAAEMAYFGAKGFNCFRLPISWERLQHTLLGSFNTTYQTNLLDFVNTTTAANWAVIVDLHNYNRYATGTHSAPGVQQAGYVQRVLGDGFLTNAHLVDVWTKLATLFVGNSKVIFNLMNESHDFPVTSTDYVTMINEQIAAIRATGATNLILVPNSRSSDVEHWSTYSPNGGPLDSVAFLNIVDSGNNYAYDMHSYHTPTSSSSYATLLSNVTNWAITNNKKLFLTELGIANTQPLGAASTGGLLEYLHANSNVWIGWVPWNLPPYELTQFTPTQSYTTDGPSMPWYTPYLVPGTVDVTPAPPGTEEDTYPSNPTSPVVKNARVTLNSGASDYWMFIPNTYDSTHNTPMKMLVWMHGCGGYGLYDVMHASIDYPTVVGQNYITLAVGGRENACWQSSSSPLIAAAVADARTRYNIKSNEIYYGGYSSGGDIGYLYAFNNSINVAGVLFQNTAPFTIGWGADAIYESAVHKFNVGQLSALSDSVYPIASVRSQMTQLTTEGYPVTAIEVAGTHYVGPENYAPGTTWGDMRANLIPLMSLGWTAPTDYVPPSTNVDVLTEITFEPIWSVSRFKSSTKHSINMSAGAPLSFAPFSLPDGVTFLSVVRYNSTRSVSSTSGSTPINIFSHVDANNILNVGFSAGSPQYSYKVSGSYVVSTSSNNTCNNDKYHCVVWTHDLSNNLRCYVDGILTNSFTVTYNPACQVSHIGVGYGGLDHFTGEIAEAMIFSGVLSDSQVRSISQRACSLWA